MPDFFYEGISREGEKIKGEIFADTETDLRIKLRTQKIRPIKIKEMAARRKTVQYIKEGKINGKFSNDDKMFFVKELLVMFKTGLTITQALEVLKAEGTTDVMRDFASSLRNYMESGMTFSQALTRFPKYFDNLFLNLVASGELRGSLEQSLSEWLEYFKKEQEINKTVNKTVAYPLAIATIVLAALAVIVIGIAPVFVHIYRTYNQPLPVSLVTISSLGLLIKSNLIIIGLAIAFVVIFFMLLVKTGLINLRLDSLILNTPGLSSFFKEIYTLKTVTAMNTALKSGLSLSRALELASEKIGNHVFEECLLRAKEAADKKELVAPFLAKSGLFRPMIIQVFSVGEIMGALPDMLTELSAHLNEETKRLSAVFSSIIEPLVLTVGGILIGALLTSFFMPVFTLLTKIK